jgi:hypothetical protein
LVQTTEGFFLDKIESHDTILNFAARGVKSEERTLIDSTFRQINVDLPRYLSQKCLETGAYLIHFTTALELVKDREDYYTKTKFESTEQVLSLASLGLRVACISLPSIVGFMNRPSYLEKQILNVISKKVLINSDVPIDRGMLHKQDFSAILYLTLINQWKSEEVITIKPITQITTEVFATTINAFLSKQNWNPEISDWPEIKEVDFVDSNLSLEPLDSSTLMKLLLNEAQRYGAT